MNIFLLLMTLLSFTSDSLNFVDPKDNEKRARRVWGAQAIPLANGEKLLTFDPEFNRASQVVVLINAPYDSAKKRVHEFVAKRLGIATEGEFLNQNIGIFREGEPRSKGMFRKLLFGNGFVDFENIGIRVRQPKEYQIKSNRYNHVESISGTSELRLRLADGRSLFGRPCALMVVYRVDRSRQYGRYYDIPLPLIVSVEDDLVTNTEIAFIEELASTISNVKPRYFVPYPWGKNEKDWLDLMKEVRKEALAMS